MESAYVFLSFTQLTVTAWDFMVIPLSRSISIESRYCSRICLSERAPVRERILSARVDLP